MKIELDLVEPVDSASSDELAKIILARLGLVPRKKDALAKFHKLLIELYERKKLANRDRKPELAVMTVEEMGLQAGIKRQTMYDHLNRWLILNVLKKTSFVSDGKIITGYELNGANMEAAFKKAEYAIQNHLATTFDIVHQFQNELKKDKLRADDRPYKPGESQNTDDITVDNDDGGTLAEENQRGDENV
ncbi:hypothetical protein H6503_06415 [Candidatus Woesearchaeota archaeon]|nr:hypothetical protein [Candidatus Woesearchaeota archaeon]